jgi:hypothetical protein
LSIFDWASIQTPWERAGRGERKAGPLWEGEGSEGARLDD